MKKVFTIILMGLLVGCSSHPKLVYYEMTIPWSDPHARITTKVTSKPTLNITQEQWRNQPYYNVYTLDCFNELRQSKEICFVRGDSDGL